MSRRKKQKQQPPISGWGLFLWTLNLTTHMIELMWNFVAEDRFLNGIFQFKRDQNKD